MPFGLNRLLACGEYPCHSLTNYRDLLCYISGVFGRNDTPVAVCRCRGSYATLGIDSCVQPPEAIERVPGLGRHAPTDEQSRNLVQ